VRRVAVVARRAGQRDSSRAADASRSPTARRQAGPPRPSSAPLSPGSRPAAQSSARLCAGRSRSGQRVAWRTPGFPQDFPREPDPLANRPLFLTLDPLSRANSGEPGRDHNPRVGGSSPSSGTPTKPLSKRFLLSQGTRTGRLDLPTGPRPCSRTMARGDLPAGVMPDGRRIIVIAA
jgi:hypothetical protein